MAQCDVLSFFEEMYLKDVVDYFSVKQVFLMLESREMKVSIVTLGTSIRKLYAWGFLDVKPLKLSTGGYTLTYRLNNKKLKDSSTA